MVLFTSTAVLTALSALWATPAYAGDSTSLYSPGGPVLQVNAKSYENLIAKSNYTSVCFH